VDCFYNSTLQPWQDALTSFSTFSNTGMLEKMAFIQRIKQASKMKLSPANASIEFAERPIQNRRHSESSHTHHTRTYTHPFTFLSFGLFFFAAPYLPLQHKEHMNHGLAMAGPHHSQAPDQ
jgi:hypothetical protein